MDTRGFGDREPGRKERFRLETERLYLREMTWEDHDALAAVLTDGETMRYYPAPYDAAGVDRWIAWCLDSYEKRGFGLWAVILKETGEMIGDTGLSMQPIHGEWLPEIGYHFRKDLWRRGYAKEAATAVRDWAFENTDFPALYSYMTVENLPSAATARSVGMTWVEDYTDERNGERLSVYRVERGAV